MANVKGAVPPSPARADASRSPLTSPDASMVYDDNPRRWRLGAGTRRARSPGWRRSPRLGRQPAPETPMEAMSLEAAGDPQDRVYGSESFPLVGVPLVLKVHGGRRPMQLVTKMAKKLLLHDTVIFEKDGTFHRPGGHQSFLRGSSTELLWRFDAERDCVVIDFVKNGKLLNWRYDELRLMKAELAPSEEFHVGGSVLEDSTYLAGVGTAGAFHWQYQLRVQALANKDALYSSAFMTWSDETDLRVPYDPDVVTNRVSVESTSESPHMSSDDNDADDSPSSESARSSRLCAPSPRFHGSRSPARSPSPPPPAAVNAPSAPISPRPMFRETPRLPAGEGSGGFCQRLLARCPLSVRRCCRRRAAAGGADRGQEAHAEEASAEGIRSNLRSWRLRMAARVVNQRRRETLPTVVVTLTAPAAGMKCKLLNEELPNAQKENADGDP